MLRTNYEACWSIGVFLVCTLIVAEACCPVRRPAPTPRRPPPVPPPRPDPPPVPPPSPPRIGGCPSPKTETANRGQSSKNIVWNIPFAAGGTPPVKIVQASGGTSGSVFTCDGSLNNICYYASSAVGKSANCCFNVGCTTIRCLAFDDIEQGMVTCSNGNVYGSQCTVECSVGYDTTSSPYFSCEAGEIWTEIPSCERVYEPELVDSTCPADVTDQSSNEMAEWVTPSYIDGPTGEALEVSCFPQSPVLLGVGTHKVECEPDIRSTTKYEVCEFIITVQYATCSELHLPENGALSYLSTAFTKTAVQSCKSGWDISELAEFNGYTGQFICFNRTHWVPETVYDCSEKYDSFNDLRLPNQLQYYTGNCADVQDQIAMNFVELVGSQSADLNLQQAWKSCSGCTYENVRVECGAVNEGRKKRSLYSMFANIDHSIHGRSTVRNVVQFKFDIVIGVPKNHDPATLFALRRKLTNVGRAIGVAAPEIQEVDGLELERHEVPVVYHRARPVCESGFSSSPKRLTCVACPSGTFNDEEDKLCVPCPIGQYQNKIKQTSCNSCPPNTSTLRRGTVNITDCIAFCEPGTSSPTGLEPCSYCDDFSFQPNMRAITCIPCPEGTRSSPPADTCSLFSDCASSPCAPGATCTDDAHGSTCHCPVHLQGPTCEEPIPQCKDDSCANGGTCIEGWPDTTCVCPEDTTGEICDIVNVDGQWSEWSAWSECSVTCGCGNITRIRSCSNPVPFGNGLPCKGHYFQIDQCNLPCCPVCQPIPFINHGYLRCNITDDWDHICTHSCDVGYVTSVTAFETYSCGPASGYIWNIETEHNRDLRMSTCARPHEPEYVDVTYYSKYTGLTCTRENKAEVNKKIRVSVERILDDVCKGEPICSSRRITVEGCPGGEDDSGEGTTVAKAVTFKTEYHPEFEDGRVNNTHIAPIIGRLFVADSDLHGSISVFGQNYHVDISTRVANPKPLCSEGASSDLSSVRCVHCEKGSYWKDGSCEFCRNGFYQPSTGALSCLECPPGTTSNIGASARNRCIPATDD